MPAHTKRANEEPSYGSKSKKIRFDNDGNTVSASTSSRPPKADVDFPRGGGTSLSALDNETLRNETFNGVNDELFKTSAPVRPKTPAITKTKGKQKEKRLEITDSEAQAGDFRPHNLTYRNLARGTKILCRVIAVKPLALIVSLPFHLVGHIPITNVSPIYTQRLDSANVDDDGDVVISDDLLSPPPLSGMFLVGDYLRATVVDVKPQGAKVQLGVAPVNDEEMASGGVELSLDPALLNADLSSEDFQVGFATSATVKSVEDHGYILDFGTGVISGFLSFREAEKRPHPGGDKLSAGLVINCLVTSRNKDGRTCKVSVDPSCAWGTTVEDGCSLAAVLPGTKVPGLVTDESSDGIAVQFLGLFDGTVEALHLPRARRAKGESWLGTRIEARVLFDVTDGVSRSFALSMLPHILDMNEPTYGSDEETGGLSREVTHSIGDAFPVGTQLSSVKVTRCVKNWGLTCEVTEGVLGFVPQANVSDTNVTISEASGHYRVGTTHPARVLHFCPMDALLMLTMQQSILGVQYLTADDVKAGDVVKVTVKKLMPTYLLVSLSDKLKGVVLSSHFSDIRLKHPELRFGIGKTLKARVHCVEPEMNRIRLTLKKTLIHSDLPIISRFEDAQLGTVAHGTIFKCYDTGVLVEYFGGVVAFVGREELSDEHVPSVTDAFPLGRVIKTRIIAINPVNRKLSASIRKAVSEPKAPVAGKQLTIGAIVDALVVAVHENRVQLEIEGKVPAVCFIRDLASHKNEDVAVIRSAIKAGDVIPGLEVRRKDRAGDAFICGPPRQFHKEPREKLAPTQQIGEVVEAAVVCRKGSHTELTVEGVKATLFPTDACDNYGESDPQPFPEIGSTVRAVVVAVKKTSLDLSTRRSRSQPNSDTKIVNPEITSTHDLHLEQSIGGFVYEAEEKYFRVSIGRRVSAILPKTALGPHNVEVGSIIKARIMELNDKKIVLSLRSRDRVQQAAAKRLALEDLVIGREINTRVERVKNNGLILRIDHTKISGLCRRVELTDNAHADVEEALQGFKPGDLLHAIILKVDIEKKEVEFSLRKSRLSAAEGSSKGAENLLPFDATEVEMQETFGIIGSYTTRRKTTQSKESEHLGEISDEDDDHVVIRMDGDGHIPETSKPDVVEAPSGPALSLFGFNWFGTHQNNSDAMSDEEDNEVGPPTPVDGLNDAGSNSGGMDVDDDDERMPGSSAEFERRLKETPDSSTLWIQFMASQLQLSEIDKAREVGRRAVEVINYREEQEKLNIWLALLNLEIEHGTEESLRSVFNDACKMNDAKTIHLRLAGLLDEAEKYEDAEEMYNRAIKRFSTSSKVWTSFGKYYLQRGKLDDARELLPRSLKSLEKRKHLKTITKFAQLEYQLGDPERGKTIFEGVISSHPKRLDLWSIYIDQEAKAENVDTVRHIFNRLIKLKLSSKKARSFFKKWLELERTIGDEDGAEVVKTKAIEWTRQNGLAGES